MVLGYDYSKQKRQWRQTNAPHPPAILMTTVVRRSITDSIAQCGMSRATPEATWCRHRATTHSVSPQRPPGQQANKQQSTNTPRKLAVSVAMAMRRYVTGCIAWWRRLRALLEATGRRHRVSIMPKYTPDMATTFLFYVFIFKTVGKGHGSMLRTLFLIGVWCIKQKRRA